MTAQQQHTFPNSASESPITGVFDHLRPSLFTTYRVQITFLEWAVGGVPQKPELIESWLRHRVLGGDEELALQLRKTLADLEIAVPEGASREELIAAANQIAATRNGNTFRRDDRGLCLAGYQVKAALKESVSILYPWPGFKWGATKKTPRSLLAERVFVNESMIPLGRDAPDDTLTQIGHVSGPQGRRSTLTYYDRCWQPEISFTVASSEDIVTREQWSRIFIQAEMLGLGALRSLGYGQFRVTGFDQV